MGLKFRISSVQNSPLYSASLVCAQVYFEILRLQEKPAARISYLPSFMGITREKLPIYELLRRIGLTPADPYDFDITLNAVKFGYLFSNAGLSNEKSANFTWKFTFFAPFISDRAFEKKFATTTSRVRA